MSFKRVMNSNNYIIKTSSGGVKVVTIYDLERKKFSIKQLFKAEESKYGNTTDSLQL